MREREGAYLCEGERGLTCVREREGLTCVREREGAYLCEGERGGLPV